MLQVIFHIARNTFRECLRQPIFVILQLSSLTIIGAYPAMALFVFREQEKLVTDGSLATILFFGLISAVLCASHAIYREIETGTVLLILSKPISRPTFIVAKMLGILTALTIFVLLNGIATLLAVRVAIDQFQIDKGVMSMHFGAILLACLWGAFANFRRKQSFSATTCTAMFWLFLVLAVVVWFMPEYKYGYDWSKGGVGYSRNLVAAIALVLFAVWAMGALATALSTSLALVPNMLVCLVLFCVGLISDYMYGRLEALRLPDMLRLMHYWPQALLPWAVLFWYLAAKQFHERRQKQVSSVTLHLAFASSACLLVMRAVVGAARQVQLEDPSWLMQKGAIVLYSLKSAVAGSLYVLIPNWQFFWMADSLTAERDIPLAYLINSLIYVDLLVFVFFLLALLLFAGREVGLQAQQ